jgi:hypothetical protein
MRLIRGIGRTERMIQRVIDGWRRTGVKLNGGASSGEIGALEKKLGVVSHDVRLYFALADGMHDGEVDEHLINFWPIAKILREADGTSAPPEVGLAIADVMIESWRICLRPAEGRVAVVTDPPSFVLPSLAEFFERYVNNPEALGL